jgi:Big-like domain-containing protein/galactose oxidase-like protein
MKKRSRIGLGLTLVTVLAVGPQFTLATTARGHLGNKPTETAKRIAAPPGHSVKPARTPFTSKLLLKRPSPSASAQPGLPGQTSTLLSDGHTLKIGGLQEDGPSSIALIGDLSFQLQRARAWHTATMLPDGDVLIVGGIGSNGAVEEAIELLNLETTTSEILAGTRVSPRVYHTATLLTEGLVLIVGGLSIEGLALRSAELWDFRSKTVAAQAKLRTARYNHTASLLPNGKVLVTGGSSDEIRVLESSELYDPSKQRFTRADAGTSSDPQSPATEPRVSGSLPEDGATAVPMDSFVALRFSKQLRVDSVNTTTVVLKSLQGRVEVKVIPAEGGMLGFVTPNVPLLPGVTYSVALAGASDADGSLVEQAIIKFTTANGIPRGRVWVPDERNFNGDWTSGFPPSPWQELPAYNGPAGVTALSGQVLRVDGWPLEHVVLRIGERSIATDNTGRFLLTDIEAGRKSLIVDCRPATTRKEAYGYFMIAVDVLKANETNVLPFTIFMPVLAHQARDQDRFAYEERSRRNEPAASRV